MRCGRSRDCACGVATPSTPALSLRLPPSATGDFEKYVRGHAEILAKKLEAGEAMDQLDDAKLLAIARRRLN